MSRAVDFVGERFGDFNEKAGVGKIQILYVKKKRIVNRRFDFKFKIDNIEQSNTEEISI